MTTPQRKINSGFDAESTATDVLDGMDLSGKLALVTGGYSGLGLETTRALAEAGATVVVPARRQVVAAEAVSGVPRVEVDQLDLSDLESVRDFAERFVASGRAIDFVIDNAGIMACPLARVGPGWESQFATNHLGHFALINRLWPAIVRGGARVVSVSSAGHHRSPIRWDDLGFDSGYDKWEAYGQSKTANVLFAVHLDYLAKDVGVRSFSLHPGGILTPLQRHLPHHEMVSMGWIDDAGNPTEGIFKTPQQGAATQVWAATSPQLNGMGGVYCHDCDIAEISLGDGTPGVREYAVDAGEASRLWQLSAQLTGVDAFAE